jgi:hypothetical protein
MGGFEPSIGKTTGHQSNIQHEAVAPGRRTLTQDLQPRHGTSSKYAPPPKLDDEDIELRAIVAGLRAAQHALDSARTPAQAAAACEAAIAHLTHVSNAAGSFYGAHGKAESAVAAARSFAVSLEALRDRAPDAVPSRLDELTAVVRDTLGAENLSPARRHKETASDKSYVRNAIAPALELITVRTREGLETLESAPAHSPNRDAQVAALAAELTESSRYASGLLKDLTFEERQQFAVQAEVAAAEIQKLVRWVRTRAPHKAMEASMSDVIFSFNVVLRHVGLTTIERSQAGTLSEGGLYKGEQEQASVGTAAEGLRDAIETLERSQSSAVDTFNSIAGLEDLAQPSFAEEVLKAVIVATLGYFTSGLIRVITTLKAATMNETTGVYTPAVMMPEPFLGLFTVGINSANASIQTAWSKVTKDNSVALARAVYCEAVRADIGAKADAYKANVTKLTSESAASSTELDTMTQAILKAAAMVEKVHVQQLSHGWTTYLARSRLHTRTDGTANTRNYFGTPTEHGREFGTSKQATHGVMQLLMVVDRGGRTPRQDVSATKIVGLNTQLMGNVIADAGHDLNRVRSPKELHVRAEFGRAVIVVDEHNRFQDATDWDQVKRSVGVTALQFWKMYGGKLRLP